MINNEIKSTMVNVVTEDGKGLKLMSLNEAIELAKQTNEDVICLNDSTEVPVVKIMDYGKFQYEKNKKAKDNKKKARLNTQGSKKIVISDSIAEHDLMVKANNIDRLLKDGNKVKLVITYKGRSIKMIEHGPSKLQTLVRYIKHPYRIESEPSICSNEVVMCIVPNKVTGKQKGRQ